MSLLNTFKCDAIALGLSPDYAPAVLRFRASARDLYKSCQHVTQPRLARLMEDAETWRITFCDLDLKAARWEKIVNDCKELVNVQAV